MEETRAGEHAETTVEEDPTPGREAGGGPSCVRALCGGRLGLHGAAGLQGAVGALAFAAQICMAGLSHLCPLLLGIPSARESPRPSSRPS